MTTESESFTNMGEEVEERVVVSQDGVRVDPKVLLVLQ